MKILKSSTWNVTNPVKAAHRRKVGRLGLAGSAIFALAALTACGDNGNADEFPSDTVELIIPYAAGGSTDVSLRLMADIAEETCGTTFIASNQTGSAGAVGFSATSNAEPDGYTVGATATELSILHQMGVADIAPEDLKGVMRYALNPHVMFVPADSPYDSIDDVIDAAENGETINAATPGTGSAAHLSLEGLALEADIPGAFTNVPFDGDATALQAVMGGNADLIMMTMGTALPQVEAGAIKAIAVAGEERFDELPDTPTLIESGVDWETGAHLGLAVPPETPDETVDVLHECLHEAIQDDRYVEGMADQNLAIDHLPPAEFEQYLQDLEEQFGAIIEEAEISE
ncbi:tripartite tricarboxylate transporter substrate binding protein [Yaniella flava]|uniref:Tripartite tricarboxylate transporter substrate binding protein n=1 Tax=Yaniella flava TaxID=287930 RepID=A0ABP5FTG8_9MICC